jgi:ABC-type sulfate transport system substrate-binding protein
MTDPTRSNSGQLTLSLWVQQKLGGGSLDRSQLGDPQVQTLVNLVKRSVYQPPRSTDVLLQEFIARGLNDADVATVYESIALYRWSQSQTSQGRPYQIYYLNPTIETVSTAAIVRRNVDGGQAKAASTFLNFLTEPAQQAVFVQHGFRPTQAEVQVDQVPNTPWQQNIPGVQVNPKGKIMSPPSRQTVSELIRLWQRGN